MGDSDVYHIDILEADIGEFQPFANGGSLKDGQSGYNLYLSAFIEYSNSIGFNEKDF